MTIDSVVTASKRPQTFLHIPDMLANWPWQRRINPLYEEVTAEGNAWLRSLAPFNPKSQIAFEKCNFGLVASLLLPDAPRGQYVFRFCSTHSPIF